MSYHEPNANVNWDHLKERVGWARRIDGIRGFDAVHRACGQASQTEWFVSVDADTQIRDAFLDLEIDIFDVGARNFCWASFNPLNTLSYGNGGLKLWHKPFAQKMAFHEYGHGLDFCWDKDYKSIPEIYSDVYVTGSKEQAYRAGYREGFKLVTLQGKTISPAHWDALSPTNRKIVQIWCSVGADTPFGHYAILGARMGVIDNYTGRTQNSELADFQYIDSRLASVTTPEDNQYLTSLKNQINSETPLKIVDLDSTQSAFIKQNFKPYFGSLK